MIKVLFICHGNICRSPMGEFILRDMVNRRGLGDLFHIASAATSREEIGNPIYPPAKRKLAEYGIRSDGHRARQLTKKDYEEYDYLFGMEQYNIRNMMRILLPVSRHSFCPVAFLRFRFFQEHFFLPQTGA